MGPPYRADDKLVRTMNLWGAESSWQSVMTVLVPPS